MNFDTELHFSQEFSLIWFFLIFVGAVAWAYWPGHKKQYDDAARSILEEDDKSGS